MQSLCNDSYNDCRGYIALDGKGKIIAYAVVKKGYLDFEVSRFLHYPISMDFKNDYTLAPSVADDYQSKGIGSQLMEYIIQDLKG